MGLKRILQKCDKNIKFILQFTNKIDFQLGLNYNKIIDDVLVKK